MSEQRFYAVIGSPRSGTSLVAGILHKNDIYMGTQFYPAGKPINPAGFYEDQRIANANVKILHDIGGNFLSPPSDERIIEGDHAAKLREKLNVIKVEAKGHDWGFKDPRVILLWPIYRRILVEEPGCHFICTHRNPLSIAHSWIMHKQMTDRKQALRIAAVYISKLSEIVSSLNQPLLHIGFEDWWHFPDQNRTALDAFVGRKLDYSHFDEKLWRA